jgi:hypothetical protein
MLLHVTFLRDESVHKADILTINRPCHYLYIVQILAHSSIESGGVESTNINDL